MRKHLSAEIHIDWEVAAFGRDEVPAPVSREQAREQLLALAAALGKLAARRDLAEAKAKGKAAAVTPAACRSTVRTRA